MDIQPFPDKNWGYKVYKIEEHEELALYYFDKIWYMVGRVSESTVYLRLRKPRTSKAVRIMEMLMAAFGCPLMHLDVQALARDYDLFQKPKPVDITELKRRLGKNVSDHA